MNILGDDSALEAVVFDGIRFLESLATYYGPEKGMAVWESMGEAVGRDVKGRVFFALLTGTHSGRIKFTANPANSNAVAAIKCIRTHTGMGLKEAKDLWYASKTQPITIDVAPDRQRAFAQELRNLGCNVT
jgi:hypothetical protein